jgi:putative ABC transport system ATP-binding protein
MNDDPPVSDIAIRCRDLHKWFGAEPTRVAALRGINIDVHSGELLMLVGPSGCGKTTLISVLAGILDRDAGQCSVLGTDLGALPKRERARFRARSIGFVFQQFNLMPSMTAAENVAIQLLLQGVGLAAALKAARSALADVGLSDRSDSRPPTLSGGQQQRVAIARAVVHNPRLLVCDEPTSALDHETGHLIMQNLRRAIDDRQTTAIVVTHDRRILEFADRVAFMDDGRIARVHSREEAERIAL